MGKSNKFSLTTKSHSSTRVNPYDKITFNALNVSCPDKQIVLPKLESNGSQLIFIELYSLFIFVVALGTQYLNLYRSMWWLLPKARNQQSLNNHLIIDSDVSQFSLIFIGQSSIIAIIRALMYKANILPARFNLLAQCHQMPLSTNTTATTLAPTTITTNSPSTYGDSDNKQQQTSSNSQLATLNSQNNATASSSSSVATLTTIVTALASWICSYHLFKCAYRIWADFGLNGLSFVSYPIVSIAAKSRIILIDQARRTTVVNSQRKTHITHAYTGFVTHVEFNSYHPSY
jgi:hypothetical protein